MKTRQIHGLGLGEFLIFAPAKEMLKSAYFFSALCISRGFSLINKKAGNPTEFIRLRELLDKRYTCVQISNSEYFQFSFKSGHSIEVIFKSLKWLFIEQDITYWNRSGGAMLYNGLCKIWD